MYFVSWFHLKALLPDWLPELAFLDTPIISHNLVRSTSLLSTIRYRTNVLPLDKKLPGSRFRMNRVIGLCDCQWSIGKANSPQISTASKTNPPDSRILPQPVFAMLSIVYSIISSFIFYSIL